MLQCLLCLLARCRTKIHGDAGLARLHPERHTSRQACKARSTGCGAKTGLQPDGSSSMGLQWQAHIAEARRQGNATLDEIAFTCISYMAVDKQRHWHQLLRMSCWICKLTRVEVQLQQLNFYLTWLRYKTHVKGLPSSIADTSVSEL